MQGDNDGPLDAFGRAFGARVDGASPRGFLRFLSLTAFQAEGCGIARRAMSIKSALRVWLSVSYSMIRILVIGSLRSPPPIRAAPDFHLKVKRLTMICASLALLHPLLSLTHWIFRSLMLPYKSSSHSANHVRCASTGKRVTRFSGRFASLRIVFPCHLYAGGRIKHRETFLS